MCAKYRTLPDRLHFAVYFPAYCFNSRTRTGCDGFVFLSINCAKVSTHAPARGATSPIFQALAPVRFQLTHPHGVRQSCIGDRSRKHVSTHAPARGATTGDQVVTPSSAVSTHAPARGATHITHSFRTPMQFQLTHPHGVRLIAPRNKAVPERFNSRTRTGCDIRKFTRRAKMFCFNSRTRTGCDSARAVCPRRLWCFNSRTRTGCDQTNKT